MYFYSFFVCFCKTDMIFEGEAATDEAADIVAATDVTKGGCCCCIFDGGGGGIISCCCCWSVKFTVDGGAEEIAVGR